MRLYLAPAVFHEDVAVLDLDASRRLVSVLRLRAGAALRLFDGAGHEREATVVEARRERAVLALGAAVEALAEPLVPVTLVCAFPRGQRGDWLVEKATELGVARLVPLEADHSVLRPGDGRVERWRRIAIEAAEQCGRAVVPEIGASIEEGREAGGRGSTGSPRTGVGSPRTGVGPPRTGGGTGAPRTGGGAEVRTDAGASASFPVRSELVEGRLPVGGRFELVADFAATTPIRDALAGLKPTGVTIYVGPEGGWSEAERAEHRAAGRVRVTLGPRTLRVETAALVALSQVLESTGGVAAR